MLKTQTKKWRPEAPFFNPAGNSRVRTYNWVTTNASGVSL